MATFNLQNIPSQKGRIAIVTGANVGLGYETAVAFAKKDMKVIMACRNMEKAMTAKNALLQAVPTGDVEVMKLDLSRLRSVKSFAQKFLNQYQQLDILVNNAGIMMPPFSLTEDRFESQIGVNHLGHFVLTGLLLKTILKTTNSRIVSVSSNAHKSGKINFDDFQTPKKYSAWKAYAQSKLACLMFAYELQRRLENTSTTTISVAAHPGGSNTELGRHLPSVAMFLAEKILPFLIHSPAEAAETTLYAALGNDISGSDYIGPSGRGEWKGKPKKVHSTSLAKNEEVAKKLWKVSERLTNFSYLN